MRQFMSRLHRDSRPICEGNCGGGLSEYWLKSIGSSPGTRRTSKRFGASSRICDLFFLAPYALQCPPKFAAAYDLSAQHEVSLTLRDIKCSAASRFRLRMTVRAIRTSFTPRNCARPSPKLEDRK